MRIMGGGLGDGDWELGGWLLEGCINIPQTPQPPIPNPQSPTQSQPQSPTQSLTSAPQGHRILTASGAFRSNLRGSKNPNHSSPGGTNEQGPSDLIRCGLLCPFSNRWITSCEQ